MKVNELAKKLNTGNKELLKLIKDMGYEYDHHAHKLPDDVVTKIEANMGTFAAPPEPTADERLAFGINKDGKIFSVIELKYTGGDFSAKLRAVAEELKVDITFLIKTLEANGYPVIKNNYTEDIMYKSSALREFKKYAGNSDIFEEE